MLQAQSETTGAHRCHGAGAGGPPGGDGTRRHERLDSVTHRVGQSMEQTTRNTTDHLRSSTSGWR